MDYKSAIRFAAKTAFEAAEKEMAAAGDSANRKEIDTKAQSDAWYVLRKKPEVVEYVKRTYGDDHNRWVEESILDLNFVYEEIRYTEGIKRYAEDIDIYMNMAAEGVLKGETYPSNDRWNEFVLKNQDKEYPSLTWDEIKARGQALIEKHKSWFLNEAANILAYAIQEEEPEIMDAIVLIADPELQEGELHEDIKEVFFEKLHRDLLDVYFGKSITIKKISMDDKFIEDFLGRSSNDPYSLNEEDIKLIRSHCVEKLNATGVVGKWCFDALSTNEINVIVKMLIILKGGNALAPLPPANEIIRRYGDDVCQGILLAEAEKNKWKIKAYRFGKIMVIASIIIFGVMYFFGLI